MGTISGAKKPRARRLSRTQLKYSSAYIAITAVILVFLNIYAATTTRNLVFRSKHTSLEDKVQLAATALADSSSLRIDLADQVVNQLGSLNATRVLVTDDSGLVIYDTMNRGSAQGQYALLPEVVWALEGYDVFYSSYAGGELESRAASPILYNRQLIGAVYLMEYDLDGGTLIRALQKNIFLTSLALGCAVILFSLVFSGVFSTRMRRIFRSIRIIREGDYTHKLKIRGRDELAALAEEFNELTVRLQESEERRRQFVSDASHELKTPLTSIKLLSDSILQNEMDGAMVREFVQDIGNEADRLTRMSQKLLSLTKMDAGKTEDREIEEIGDTVERVLRMLAPVAQINCISLRNETFPGATVLMVEDDLYQIIFNLVENGIKYNRTGGSLRVCLERQKDDYILSVFDTGVGIPKEALPHIFERFYRVDKARSRQAGGSGLGLSIVHDMVKRNYGTIAITQNEGGGSCFTVTFPAFDLEDTL